MNLLVVTQVVDEHHPTLGFFCGWLRECATRFDQIDIIALQVGSYDLPDTVRVHTLGKREGQGAKGTMIYHSALRLRYAIRFLMLCWKLRKRYEAVFVHMNQEYLLLAGLLWLFWGKRIYLWRNHYQGSWLTDLAASFCTRVFCTSRHSYTARYTKTRVMPVGVDTRLFSPDPQIRIEEARAILFLARMAPSKRPEILIEALGRLAKQGIPFVASFVGSPLPRDLVYHQKLIERVTVLGIQMQVSFFPAVPNTHTPDIYRKHRIFVNASPSGMFDKTLFEAAACGCYVLAASEDFLREAGDDHYFSGIDDLAEKLKSVLGNPPVPSIPAFVTRHSVTMLADQLALEMRR